MITLQYGRQKPQNGNKGTSVFDALAANIDLDDSHDHNGINGKPIQAYNLARGTRSILDTDFSLDVPSGWYTATVTMPPGYTLDTSNPFFIVVGGTYGGMSFIPDWTRNGGSNQSLIVWMPTPQTLNMVCL